jgi:hypothetical protein
LTGFFKNVILSYLRVIYRQINYFPAFLKAGKEVYCNEPLGSSSFLPLHINKRKVRRKRKKWQKK